MRPTTHPDDESLAAIALDEADIAPEERRHVAECEQCTGELGELRRTIRLASFAAQPSGESTERPGAGVWSAVAAEVHAELRSEPASPSHRSHSHAAGRRGRPLGAMLLLAAACLVVGGVVGRVLAPSPDQPGPPAPGRPVAVEVASGQLDAVRGAEAVGTATVSRIGPQTALTLSLPRVDPREGYLEVWLLDRELDQMVSVGVVGDSWTPTFSIPKRLLVDGYLVVDISRQAFDGGPQHSGDSVIRGTLST